MHLMWQLAPLGLAVATWCKDLQLTLDESDSLIYRKSGSTTIFSFQSRMAFGRRFNCNSDQESIPYTLLNFLRA